MVDFLFALIELNFYAIYYGSGAMRRNVYRSAVFAEGSTSLHSNFTWTGSSPVNHSWLQKLERLGYPMVKTTSFCVSSF